MSIGEILDTIEMNACQRRDQIELHKQYTNFAATLTARIIHQLPILVGLVLDGNKSDYPSLESMLPPDVVKATERERQIAEANRKSAQIQQYAAIRDQNDRQKRFRELQMEAARRQAEDQKRRKEVTD